MQQLEIMIASAHMVIVAVSYLQAMEFGNQCCGGLQPKLFNFHC
jgi:hypothetical protein